MWQAWKNFGQWVEDFRWSQNMMAARRERRRLLFSSRMNFDDALRPSGSGGRIAYPDAIYHVTADDVVRAMRVANFS